LIVRFYEVTSGQILIDGLDTAQLPPEVVRDRVAYVEPDSPVLPGTIRDNLMLIAPQATDAGCWDMLDALELGTRSESRQLGWTRQSANWAQRCRAESVSGSPSDAHCSHGPGSSSSTSRRRISTAGPRRSSAR
jgi:hypothetical protein